MRYALGRVDYALVSKASVVIVTGNDETAVFCRTVADLIRKHNMQQGDLWGCETLAEFEQRARHPAFFGRWWYTGSADRLSAEDKKALERLKKKPVEFGTAVLVGIDFNKYRGITKGMKSSPHVHEISASFPSRRFLVGYIQNEVAARGAGISQGAAETFIWRLGEFYSRYEYYIDLLISELPTGSTEVKKEHIIATLRGVQGASFDDFFSYLMKPLTNGNLKRTTKLFRSYQCMLEDMGALRTLRKVHTKAVQYLEIRRLIDMGYIPVGVNFTVEAFKQLLKLPEVEPEETQESDDKGKKEKKQNQADSKFTYKDILRWSDWKFKREVEIAASAPLADWYVIALLSSKRCYTDAEAERVLFDIMTRSRRTDVLGEELKKGVV